MKAKVYFVKAKRGEDLKSVREKTRWLLENAGLKRIIKKDELVALKLSFGEAGNTGHVDARHARFVADEVTALKGKLAAGFTVSSLPSGDKQSTLISMFVFSMQHGMIWVGNPILPEQHRGVPYDEAANRLGSWSGLMAQAGHSSPADSFVSGDIKTARMFGRNFSETLHRITVAP